MVRGRETKLQGVLKWRSLQMLGWTEVLWQLRLRIRGLGEPNLLLLLSNRRGVLPREHSHSTMCRDLLLAWSHHHWSLHSSTRCPIPLQVSTTQTKLRDTSLPHGSSRATIHTTREVRVAHPQSGDRTILALLIRRGWLIGREHTLPSVERVCDALRRLHTRDPGQQG